MTPHDCDAHHLAYFHAALQFRPLPQHPQPCPLCQAQDESQRATTLARTISILAHQALADIPKIYREIFYNIYDYHDSCPYNIANAHYIIDSTPKTFHADLEEGNRNARNVLAEHANLLMPTMARRILNQHAKLLRQTPLGPISTTEIKKARHQIEAIARQTAKDIKAGTKIQATFRPEDAPTDDIEFLGVRQKRPDRPLSILLTELEHVTLTHMPRIPDDLQNPLTRKLLTGYLNGILAYSLHNTRYPSTRTPMILEDRIRMSPMANELYQAIRDRFHEKYCRPLSAGDPLFPDFDSPTPTPMGPEKVKELLAATAQQQGICPLTILQALGIQPEPAETAAYMQRYFSINPRLLADPGYIAYSFLTASTAEALQPAPHTTKKPQPGMISIQMDSNKADTALIRQMANQENFIASCLPTAGNSYTTYVLAPSWDEKDTKNTK